MYSFSKAFAIFCAAALEGRPLSVFGDGTQTRDFTHVSDICGGIVAAMNPPSGMLSSSRSCGSTLWW